MGLKKMVCRLLMVISLCLFSVSCYALDFTSRFVSGITTDAEFDTVCEIRFKVLGSAADKVDLGVMSSNKKVLDNPYSGNLSCDLLYPRYSTFKKAYIQSPGQLNEGDVINTVFSRVTFDDASSWVVHNWEKSYETKEFKGLGDVVERVTTTIDFNLKGKRTRTYWLANGGSFEVELEPVQGAEFITDTNKIDEEVRYQDGFWNRRKKVHWYRDGAVDVKYHYPGEE